ncbi:SLAM family member 5 isoform X2 [Salmo trutta]|uniref:SLAM family member 5 isoform X2 n=1 Tax=Salmo trutta TaxID=8032 RepID=UPI0011322050|nr:SLAM family member 5-like isoform X2 [Salmo trutta]
MGTFLHFAIAILLTFIHQAESSSVFVLKGQDVRLDVQENVTLKELELFKWTFRSENIVRCSDTLSVKVSPEYNNRVEFYQGNFSLLLKNLQQNDSGPYTAVLNGDKEKTIIAYQLIVQERVEPPVLTVDSNSSINATCNVTVTCRGQNTSVTSSCNSSTCSQVGGESRRAETSTAPLLSVYVAGGSIICNHSNQVSLANHTKEIVELCPMKSDHGKKANYNYALTVGAPVGIVVFIFTALTGFVLWHHNKRGKRKTINTDDATVGTPENGQAGGKEQVSPGPESPTIYSMVGLPQPQPVDHQPLPVDLPMTSMNSMPESLYAMVGKKTSKQ